jgi:hypothetical protein
MATRPTFFPRIASDDTPVEATISPTIRTDGYPEDAAVPHEEYNEIFNEIDKWIEWLDQNIGDGTDGTYVSINAGTSLSLTGATATSSFIARLCKNNNNLHLEVTIILSSIVGTLTQVDINLPSSAKCAARYVGYNGPQFLANNTNGIGPQSIPCTCGFWTDDDTLSIGRSYSSLGNPIAFIDDGAGGMKFTVSIDYERLVS